MILIGPANICRALFLIDVDGYNNMNSHLQSVYYYNFKITQPAVAVFTAGYR